MRTGLNELGNNYSRILSQYPVFWNSSERTENMIAEMRNRTGDFFKTHAIIYGNYYPEISEDTFKQLDIWQKQKADFQINLTRLDNNLSQVNSEMKEIADKLNQIEFPFGKFPVGIGEAITLFPVLLAIGYLICADLLCQIMRLRKKLEYTYHKRDSKHTVFNIHEIALIVPIWIDPVQSRLRQAIKFTVFIIPFIIFLISSYLILSQNIFIWNIADILRLNDDLNQWFYGVLFLVSLAFFIYSYYCIIKELIHYHSNLKATK